MLLMVLTITLDHAWAKKKNLKEGNNFHFDIDLSSTSTRAADRKAY